MNGLTLYTIADDFLIASNKLANLDLDDQTIADTLEGLQGEMEVKAINVAMFARNLEATSEQIKLAESQMSARRTAIENRAKRIRDYLKMNMERTGITKIESPYFKIAIRDNPPAVVIDAASQIPDAFMRQPEPPPAVPDKKLIAEALKAGNAVAGCHLERGTRIEIK